MQKKHTLIALYDANPEHAHFENPIVIARARALGRALGNTGTRVVARISTPSVLAVLGALADAGVHSVALSPAATMREHEQAYRLPLVAHSTLFTGRGALGADMMAASSSGAMIVLGSYPEALENILKYAQEHAVPVGVLSDESPESIHARTGNTRIFVSHDPETLARMMAEEIRRLNLGGK